jgi:hypothetical protein
MRLRAVCDTDNTVVPAQAVVGIAVSFDGGVSHYIRLPPRTPLFPKAWGECKLKLYFHTIEYITSKY